MSKRQYGIMISLWALWFLSCISIFLYIRDVKVQTQRQMDEIDRNINDLASKTDAISNVMVDFNQELQDIHTENQQNQEEVQKSIKKLWNSIHMHKDELEEEIKRVEESKEEKRRNVDAGPSVYSSNYVASESSSEYDHDFKSQGTVNDGSYNYTWYSQRVLPGGGLDIPGRHVDEDGFIRDEEGNLCIASKNLDKGTEVETPYGKGIVYDYCPNGNLDIYTDW